VFRSLARAALPVPLLFALVLHPACSTTTEPALADAGARSDAAAATATEGAGPATGGMDVGFQIPLPLGDFAHRDPSYLFDQTKVRTYDLFLPEEELAFLDADPMREAYVLADLVFEGRRVPHVGMRYKGSLGSFVGCLDGGLFPPRGRKSCTKLSIKIKIDYADRTALFFGQTKLMFHAMNTDRTLLRERFGYDAFNALGVPASRTAHVRLRINGKLSGLYLLIEQVDGRFTRTRFEDSGEGNLYKEAWPVSSDPAYYVSALESNRAAANTQKMAHFAQQLLEADDAELPGVLERWLDVDYLARYVAVDRMLRHDDGPYHWYCAQSANSSTKRPSARPFANTVCGNHNYYWYEDTRTERFWLIPWDLDGALPSTSGLTTVLRAWDDLRADCTRVVRGLLLIPGQMPPTCDPLLRGVALSLRRRVHQAMVELARGPFADAEIDRKLSAWARQIEPYVIEAHETHPQEVSPRTWRDQVARLRSTLIRLRDEALAQIDALDDPEAEPGDAAQDAGATADAHTTPDAGGLEWDPGVADAAPDAQLSDAQVSSDAQGAH
jgi:hypothetical protein